MLALRQNGADVFLAVTVQPRASRTAVAGLHGNALKLLLTVPPVEGAANEACLRLLTDLLGVSRARLSIIRGMKARQKLICIADMSVDTLRTRLRSHYPDLDL
jgi:uncharacterized protein (TIGR00251 family)